MYETKLTPGAASLADKAKQVGCNYLASPVFGQPPAVVAKTMVCTVAGDPTAIKVVKPILDSLGRATIVIGEDVTQGELSLAQGRLGKS